MKIDFDQVIKALDGTPLTVPKEEGEGEEKVTTQEELTLKDVCINSIFYVAPTPQGQKPEEVKADDKVKQYKLALKVQEGGEQELTTEDASWLKKKVNDLYGILVAGQALIMLDG